MLLKTGQESRRNNHPLVRNAVRHPRGSSLHALAYKSPLLNISPSCVLTQKYRFFFLYSHTSLLWRPAKILGLLALMFWAFSLYRDTSHRVSLAIFISNPKSMAFSIPLHSLSLPMELLSFSALMFFS